MPYSDPSNTNDTLKVLAELSPSLVLDVGAGAGKYGILTSSAAPDAVVHASEIWEPYVSEFNLNSIYDKIINTDVRTWVAADFDPYDLVIFGDVLEHMTKEEATAVYWNVWGNVIISIPIVHYPQGHSHGNPFEEHVKDDWSVEEVLDTFDVDLVAKYETTALFLRKA